MPENPQILENLAVLFGTLNDNITALRNEVSQLAIEIRRVNILEERDSTRREELGRAFGELKALDQRLDKHERCAAEEHRVIDRWRNIIAGGCIVVSVMWTVFGAYAMDSIKTSTNLLASINTKLEIHLQEDKVKAPEDVRSIHRELSK